MIQNHNEIPPYAITSKIPSEEKQSQSKLTFHSTLDNRLKELQKGHLETTHSDTSEKLIKDKKIQMTATESPKMQNLFPLKPSGENTHSVDVKIENSVHVQSITTKIDNPTMRKGLSINDRNWSSTKSLTRSSEGFQGVLYFMDDSGNRLAVKKEVQLQGQTFAARFLQARGFSCPPIVLVTTQSDEGQEILEALKNPKLIKNEKAIVNANKISSADVVMVMPYIDGKSVSNIRPQNAADIKFIKQDQFSKDIGKLYIYDYLLGNIDRFDLSLSKLNQGNIMIDYQGRLTLIDSVCARPIKDVEFFSKEITHAAHEVYKNQKGVAESLKSIFDNAIKPKQQKKTGRAALQAIEEQERGGKQVLNKNKEEGFLKVNLILEGMREALQEIAKNADTIGNEARLLNEQICKESKSLVSGSDLEIKNQSGYSAIEAIEHRARLVAKILKEKA